MADSAKVRLVRCPKCENLLPELVDYSVYQCGGCAKEKNQEGDALSEKSDEEKARQVSSKSGNSMERAINSSDASDPGTKSNPGPLISSGPRGLEKDDVKNTERDEYKPNKRLLENGLNINMKKDDLSNPIEVQNGDLSSQIGPTSGFRGSGRKLDWPNGERGGAEGLKKNPRNNSEGMRFSTSSYLEEGPSNSLSDNFSALGKLSRDLNHVDGVNKAKYSEQEEKAELLRKLDELRDQLSRSCNTVNKTKEKVPLDDKMNMPNPYGHSSSWYPDGSLLPNRAQMPFYGPEKQVPVPSNFCPDSFPQANGNDMHGYYSSMNNNPNWFSGSGEPLGSHRPPYPFPQSHPYHSGQCIEMNPDPFTRYHPNANFHRPLCSCFHCREESRGVPPPPPTSYYNRGFHDVQNNPMLYRPDNSVLCGPGINSKSRSDIPPLSYPEQRSYSRWPSDLNSEIGGLAANRPRRTVLSSKGRLCQPIAGGAPFFTCYNCFELLKLPKKLGHNMAKNEQKIHCGACSAVIDLAFVDKKLVLPDHLESEKIHKKVGDSPYGHINHSSDNFSSDDYDNSGYDFQSVDRDYALRSAGQGLKPHEMQNLHSSSPSISEDEHSPEEGLIASREVINNLHQPIKDTLSPPPRGSPLQVYFDYSSNNQNVNRFSKGNRSSRSDQGKAKLNKVTSRQNSLQDVTLATEMDVSFNEYTNAGVTQENVDISREDNQPKVSKGGESFLANIIKKSFGSNQSDERGKGNVSINGKIIPDRAVKKAEKMAGPIHPGKYWYDFRAGFWGVMGGPCLGIIPPCIEEFNHHIPKNCAGGNTGVFVNGRELHQKDLDLLASRGLPILRDKSYIVEISGKVLDEDTGEELDSLGKLAPTVEKVKRGFGMKVLSGSS